MNWTGQLEIEGQPMGEMKVEGRFSHGEWYPPAGYAWFCPHCAEVWARLHVAGQPFMVWSRTCKKCYGNEHLLEEPGSVMMAWEKPFDAALPRKALEREFEIALRRAELSTLR